MLSTEQAAERLGITPVRVRELLRSGKLEGQRVGRSWVVDESSVRARLAQPPKAGRPAASSQGDEGGYDPVLLAQIHDLYRQCEKLLAGRYDADLYRALGGGKEVRFCAKVSDFFLQEKQRELIKQGVF